MGILYVTFCSEEKTVSVNCLLYTGSGRASLSADVIQTLGPMDSIGIDCQLKLSTLLGEYDRNFREVVLEISWSFGRASRFGIPDKCLQGYRLFSRRIIRCWFRTCHCQRYYWIGPFPPPGSPSDSPLSEGLGLLDPCRSRFIR